MELEIEGYEVCKETLSKVILETPLAAKQGLRLAANGLRKDARARTPDSGKESKQKLKKKYGVKVIEEGLNMKALVYNSAPHFHLVEQGHELIINGKNCGFVLGKHFFEKTVDEYDEKMPQIVENMINKELSRY